MIVTKAFSETVKEQIEKDSQLAVALLQEAFILTMNGDPKTARLLLRDIVNSTLGFEELSKMTGKNSKSLHRMLSAKGNPTLENFNLIFSVLCRNLDVNFEVRAVPSTGGDQEILREVEPNPIEDMAPTFFISHDNEEETSVTEGLSALNHELIGRIEQITGLISGGMGESIDTILKKNLDELADDLKTNFSSTEQSEQS